MSMKINRYLRQPLYPLVLFVLTSAMAVIAQHNSHISSQDFAGRGKTTGAASLKLGVANKARYFLGEAPTITISITNISRSPQTVKVAEYQKFSFEMTGIFEDASQQETKTPVYDGSWDIPKPPTRAPLPGETHEWLAMKKREPKFLKLARDESTTLELDLSKTFRSYLGIGKYKLIVKSEDGQKVTKEFEVYFDDEQSIPPLSRMLESDDVGERNWAVFHLARFARPKLVALLEALLKSGNEKQRDFASGILGEIKAGNYGPDPSRSNIKPSGE